MISALMKMGLPDNGPGDNNGADEPVRTDGT